MYQETFKLEEFNESEEKTLELIMPDEAVEFLEKYAFVYRRDYSTEKLLSKLSNELINALRSANLTDWLDKYTGEVRLDAKLYPESIGYHESSDESGKALIIKKNPEKELKTVGWFFDFFDYDSYPDDLRIPGEGNIRFACNRLFKDQIIGNKLHFEDEIKEYLARKDADPYSSKVLKMIYSKEFS